MPESTERHPSPNHRRPSPAMVWKSGLTGGKLGIPSGTCRFSARPPTREGVSVQRRLGLRVRAGLQFLKQMPGIETAGHKSGVLVDHLQENLFAAFVD